MKQLWADAIKNWKSTASGLCSLAVVLVLAYTALPVGAGRAVIAVALLKATIGFLQKDA